MKLTKSYKLVTLFALLLASVLCAICIGSFSVKAHADGEVKTELAKCFSYASSEVTADIDSDGTNAIVKMYDNVAVSLKNKMSVKDFKTQFTLPNNVKTFTFTVSADAYNPYGNPVTENGKVVYNSTVSYVLEFTMETGSASVKLNGSSLSSVSVSDRVFEIAIAEAGGLLKFNVNGVDYITSDVNYSINNVSNVIPATLKFDVDFADGTENGNISFKYFNQNASAGTDYATNKFYQDFVVDGNSIKNKAYAVVTLSDDLFAQNSEDGFLFEKGLKYTVTPVGCSFFGFDSTKATISSDDADVVIDGKKIAFTSLDNEGKRTLKIKIGDYTKEISIKVFDVLSDKIAPEYVGSNESINSFKAYFEDKLFDAEGKTKVSLGSSEYLEMDVSQLRKLVKDNYTDFDNLTYTIHYYTPSTSSTSSSLRIPLKDAGEYKFFVTFTDRAGNTIDEDDFFTVDNEDPNVIHEGSLYKYVFSFEIEDISKLDIKAGTPGTGYVNTVYNAPNWTITASSGYNTTYKLYYSSTNGADADWKEITAVSNATDSSKDYGDFSYDDVKKIAYDGQLKFTPNAKGFYKIVLNVTSASSTRSESDEIIIEVKDQVKIVKVDNHWLKNNVWSVVFLSVGTVCLIAIVVLLFIKPKEDDEDFSLKNNK